MKKKGQGFSNNFETCKIFRSYVLQNNIMYCLKKQVTTFFLLLKIVALSIAPHYPEMRNRFSLLGRE